MISSSYRKLQSILFIFAVIFFAMSCQTDKKSSQSTDEKIKETTSSPSPISVTNDSKNNIKTVQKNKILTAWVDKLNIRTKPNTKAKVVTTVNKNELLTFSGEQSDKIETIVLRGVAYDEPWLKIQTEDAKEGWVFGGAVKPRLEKKGNAIIDEENFNFPKFGDFILKDWKKQPTKELSEGDAETTISTYTIGSQILEITKTDVGEYGYYRTYKLMNNFREMIKKRELSFMVDLDDRTLTETVIYYKSNPMRRFTRSQKMEKHFMQLNALPMMVKGEWSESVFEQKEKDF